MATLLDFLQAASNSAASNVSGPVDGLAWLLRKAGIPVPDDAVGGSKWMEQKGLTRPVESGLINAAGETAGLLAPVAAAAKAPQIARGLLQMGENAAAPRMLNPQTGAVVYHGSPHKFDRFDSSKIGTGEGAQAYGHGLYLAESKKVADEYAAKLSEPAIQARKEFGGDVDELIKELSGSLKTTQTGSRWGYIDSRLRSIANPSPMQVFDKTSKEWIQKPITDDQLRKAAAARQLIGNFDIVDSGSLYKVDLPDTAIAKMLDWDKPLSQQPAEIQRLAKVQTRNLAAEEALVAKAQALGIPVSSLPEYAQLEKLMVKASKQNRITGADLYERFGGKATGAEKMRQAGIPGIRYLDGGSRGAGSGTSNFVVFPGEEGLLKILERNGQGL